MSKSFENSIGLRCLKKHREVDCVDSRILQCGCRQETKTAGAARSLRARVCAEAGTQLGDLQGDSDRKIKDPSVIPRVTGVAVAGG